MAINSISPSIANLLYYILGTRVNIIFCIVSRPIEILRVQFYIYLRNGTDNHLAEELYSAPGVRILSLD